MAPNGENVVVSKMKLERMLSMKGGQGEGSYVKNSQAQAEHARSMLYLLEESLDHAELTPLSESFTVADLGCSCGSNTLYIVDVIIKHMMKLYENSGYDSGPEFSAFFTDLPSNDFNTLFQLLPPVVYSGGSMEECLASDNHRSYFAAGVPGSFYRRLFPSNSINVFYSALSLHWLSQVPDIVYDKKSSAYNKGKIFIHGANEITANAYRKQFKNDLAGFLRSRAAEMKKGGSMFLVCLGRTSQDPTDQCGAGLLFGTHFQDAWNDLVQEGLISSEKRDNFNIPVYAPSLVDFKEVVEANGSFTTIKLEVFKGGSPLVVSHPEDEFEIGEALANSCRSVCGVLVDAHIGEFLSEELFSLSREPSCYPSQRATREASVFPYCRISLFSIDREMAFRVIPSS